MLTSDTAKNPIVLSYLALRKAVGAVAFSLPFVLAIPWAILHHEIRSSISGYYYTGMRDIFGGSRCAIAMFMLCCRGYDQKDEIAGLVSSFFALGVAFFPTAPSQNITQHQREIAIVHYAFAALLFLTLAYFCLVLFRMTAKNREVTPRKVTRNRVYKYCGLAIVLSICLIILFKMLAVKYLFGHVGSVFCFESTALFAFGIAWLTKGETFLKDESKQIEKS